MAFQEEALMPSRCTLHASANSVTDGCKCMARASSQADWQFAKFMPALDTELKCIVAVPFDITTFKRLGLLQAEAKRLGW